MGLRLLVLDLNAHWMGWVLSQHKSGHRTDTTTQEEKCGIRTDFDQTNDTTCTTPTHSRKQDGPIRVDFEKAAQGPEAAAKLGSKGSDYQFFNEGELVLLERNPAATV